MNALAMCDQVLQAVKSSNLNFLVQETPFSVFITIRKKFISGRVSNFKVNHPNILQANKEVIDNLEAKADQLEQENFNYARELHSLSLKLEKATKELTAVITEKSILEKGKAASDKALED